MGSGGTSVALSGVEQALPLSLSLSLSSLEVEAAMSSKATKNLYPLPTTTPTRHTHKKKERKQEKVGKKKNPFTSSSPSLNFLLPSNPTYYPHPPSSTCTNNSHYETLSTRIINGGGKNPEFNENLIMKITQFDAVLKCEIWMLSRAKNFMEDQLLGFALVPISSVLGKGKLTQDFSLSSTDLFHSPAGTVKLSLSLNTNVPLNSSLNQFPDSVPNSSISSEVVLLDRKISEFSLDPGEYSRIEFPDINVVSENQKMVSEYFGSGSRPGLVVPGSFLHLGASHHHQDYEMASNSPEEIRGGSVSPNGSIQTSGFLSSTMTSLSDDRNSADSMEKKNHLCGDVAKSPNMSPSPCPDTPTSKKGSEVRDEKEPNFSGNDEQVNKDVNMVFSAPLGNIKLEAEQSAMQQQIVDMYMKSMQQFTESLAKMKLPMDLDKPEDEHRGDVIQNHNNKLELDKNKKDSSRVFYGSRAFF